jgi:hypothetical protein
MKRIIFLLVLSCGLALPSALMAQGSDHVEVGVFADYMNFSATDPHINFVGVGGRAAFNVNPNVQLEAEMSYDFKAELHQRLLERCHDAVRKHQSPSPDRLVWT